MPKNYALNATTYLVRLDNSNRIECNMTCQLIPECIAFSFNDKTGVCTTFPNIPITYTTSSDFYAAFKVSSADQRVINGENSLFSSFHRSLLII